MHLDSVQQKEARGSELIVTEPQPFRFAYYFIPDREAGCCDERVRLCVCLSAITSSELHVRSSPNVLCILPMAMHGSVLLWRRSDMLCTSGFTNDVIFAHKPRLLDVVAQLKRIAHAALGLAINCVRSNTSCRPTDAWVYFSGAKSNLPGGNTGGGVCGLRQPCFR